jgi:hypothetical protein
MAAASAHLTLYTLLPSPIHSPSYLQFIAKQSLACIACDRLEGCTRHSAPQLVCLSCTHLQYSWLSMSITSVGATHLQQSVNLQGVHVIISGAGKDWSGREWDNIQACIHAGDQQSFFLTHSPDNVTEQECDRLMPLGTCGFSKVWHQTLPLVYDPFMALCLPHPLLTRSAVIIRCTRNLSC